MGHHQAVGYPHCSALLLPIRSIWSLFLLPRMQRRVTDCEYDIEASVLASAIYAFLCRTVVDTKQPIQKPVADVARTPERSVRSPSHSAGSSPLSLHSNLIKMLYCYPVRPSSLPRITLAFNSCPPPPSINKPVTREETSKIYPQEYQHIFLIPYSKTRYIRVKSREPPERASQQNFAPVPQCNKDYFVGSAPCCPIVGADVSGS